MTSGEYFVHKVDRSQQGEYKCIPVNELGLGAEKTIKITVEGLYNKKMFNSDLGPVVFLW